MSFGEKDSSIMMQFLQVSFRSNISWKQRIWLSWLWGWSTTRNRENEELRKISKLQLWLSWWLWPSNLSWRWKYAKEGICPFGVELWGKYILWNSNPGLWRIKCVFIRFRDELWHSYFWKIFLLWSKAQPH